MEDACVESFNGKVGSECLKKNWYLAVVTPAPIGLRWPRMRFSVTGLVRAARTTALRRRCSLGERTVLYPSARVQAVDGDRTAIAIGADTHVRGELLALPGGRLRIGSWCYVGENSRLWAYRDIAIGDRVLIAHNVSILDSLTHPLDPERRHEHFKAIVTRGHPADVDVGALPVTLEDDAWICAHAVVLRGVRIGRAAVVAAGSVVTRDVPAFTVVAGNPAKAVRRIDE